MRKDEIDFWIVMVMLCLIVLIQAMTAEACRDSRPRMQINEYDKGMYR